jgi:hypothetical protein
MATESPAAVDYVPRPSARRLWARRLRWPVVLALVALTAIWWAPALKRRIEIRYWYERCARHTPPQQDLIVWQVNDGPIGYVRGETPYIPPEWTEFYTRYSPPGPTPHGTVFLGELRTPSGRPLLVSVVALPDEWKWNRRVSSTPSFLVRAFSPGGLSGMPRQVIDSKVSVPMPTRGAAELRIGQPDPNDPSHFVIPFGAFGKHEGQLDGYLREDRVDFEAESSTATQPLPASPG